MTEGNLTDHPITSPPRPPSVHDALIAVKAELGAIGKQHDPNSQISYPYRGINRILDEAHDLLVKHGVVFAPRVVDSKFERYTTKNGAPMMWCGLTVEWIITGPDGSVYGADMRPGSTGCIGGELPRTFGEASDSSDKAANKAQTAAFKVILSQIFAIPYSAEDQDAFRPDMERVTDPWDDATDEQLERANAIARSLDSELPGHIAARVFEHMEALAKRNGVELQLDTDAHTALGAVKALPPGWLDAWDNMVGRGFQAWQKESATVDTGGRT